MTAADEPISVGLGQIRFGKSPDMLRAVALGSCVGIALYDPKLKIGALAHAMLPNSSEARAEFSPGRFVDSSISKMTSDLTKKGSNPKTLKAKLVGGAKMFNHIESKKFLDIGDRNVSTARDILKDEAIPIVAEDVGKNYGRTVVFDLSSGKMSIRRAGKKEWREL